MSRRPARWRRRLLRRRHRVGRIIERTCRQVSQTAHNPLEGELHRLGFGSVTLADLDRRAAFRLLDEWIGLGGRVLDTAAVYGRGRSEEVIGSWLTKSRRRRDLVILTKGGHPGGDWERRLDPVAINTDID